MRIIFSITDEEVFSNVRETVDWFEEENWIKFPDGTAREEFITDCAECIIDKYESAWNADSVYAPDYSDEVNDLARVYGYNIS